MKFLVVGLGNIGEEYANTRHNIGFDIVDALAQSAGASFFEDRLAYRATVKHKGRTLVLIKPTTYMNLSGKAVRYWLEKEKVPLDKLLVLVDDLAIPFGALRLRAKGGAGGHNGLTDIEQVLGRSDYARLRFGIGAEFSKGAQVKHVLSKWAQEEQAQLKERIAVSMDIIRAFSTIGMARTMSQFNNK